MLEKFLPRIDFSSYEDFKQNYKVNIPENFNFGFDIVDEWAKCDKNKIALVWCDDKDREKILTFDEISRLSNRAANWFKALGIKKGDPVLLILRRRFEYWICAVALNKIGAVIIPATLQLTAKDIVYRCDAAQVKMLVCVNDEFVVSQVEEAMPNCKTVTNKAIVDGEAKGWLTFEDEIFSTKYSEQFERPTGTEATTNDDVMLMYFTSGTTGMPKMVTHTFTHPLGHIVTAKYWQRVEENKLHMSVSDSGWAKFGWGKIYGQWICGAAIFAYDMDKFVPLNLLEKIVKYKVATFCAPPTMFRFMLQEDLSKFDLSCIKAAGIAGEPLNPEIYKKFQAVTGLKLTEGFGQSETTVLIANFPWFEPKPGSTGKPSPLYNIDIVDENGNSCEDGEEGEIVVRGIKEYMPPGLFTCYYKSDELTEKCMGQGYYKTGDVAWRDSDGYYWFVGRNDDVIKCSGYRIGPFEVESALLEHPSVLECAVTAAPDEIRGQVVKATVVLTQKYRNKLEDEEQTKTLKKQLQEHVKHVTAPYKYPRIIEFVDELPKTVGGKIKRALIRQKDTN